MDLALNNLQRLICHKIQPTNWFFLCIENPEFVLVRIHVGSFVYIYLPNPSNTGRMQRKVKF